MQSYTRLTLSRRDLRAAILYWLKEYHGLCFADWTGDKVNIPRQDAPTTVILRDNLN